MLNATSEIVLGDVTTIYTLLPRLVRMRTIKVTSFLIENPPLIEQFLEIFGIFEQGNLDLK